MAGLTWPQVMSSSNNVLLTVQAWGTPSAWRHVPRPPIRWVLSGRWVLSEPCQYIPCPLLPTTWSCVLFVLHNINHMVTHLLCFSTHFFIVLNCALKCSVITRSPSCFTLKVGIMEGPESCTAQQKRLFLFLEYTNLDHHLVHLHKNS